MIEKLEQVLPKEIEKRSFQIIGQELLEKGIVLEKEKEKVIKRAIHTSADFEYADSLCFSKEAVALGKQAIAEGVSILTDTQMAKAGINKKLLAEFGGEVHCFMSDEDVAKIASQNGTTRATASMDKAVEMDKDLIYVVGNAPTALVRIYEHIKAGRLHPRLIIGVPVGFVNVEVAKEMIMTLDVPYIIARGRKGGSNVAAAICNALLYELKEI